MRKIFLPFFFLLVSPLYGKGEGKYFDIKDFHCGMDSYHSSLTIDDCYVKNAQNVWFDKDAGLVKREGYTTFFSSGGYAYSGAWQYTDAGNQVWMIVRSSNALIATTNGTSSVLVSTITSTDLVASANAFGLAYFVDQTQGVYYWNGTSTTYVSGSPKGSLIANFHGRVWVSGLQVPYGNYVYGSEYLDGTNWTVGSLATDPILFQVGLADHIDQVTSLTVFLDTMYVFKNQTIHAIYGFDQTDFQISILNTETGCVDGGSVQPWQKGLIFMSARGLEFFDGYRSELISRPIDSLVKAAGQSSFRQLSWQQTTKGDFDTGTISPTGYLSTSISDGNVVLSTQVAYSTAVTTQGEWSVGTLSNMTATSVPGSIKLSLTWGSEFLDQNVTSGLGHYLVGKATPCNAQSKLAQGFYSLLSGSQKLTSISLYGKRGADPYDMTLEIQTDNSGVPSGTVLVSATMSGSCWSDGVDGWCNVPLTPTAITATTPYWIVLYQPSDSGPACDQEQWVYTNPSSYDRGSAMFYNSGSWYSVGGTADFNFREYTTQQNAYYSTGSYTSQIFDIGTDTNTFVWNWDTFSADSTLNGQTIDYRMTVSSSPTGPWDSTATVTSGTPPTVATKRYAVVIASFSTTDTSVSPVLNNFSFGTSEMRKSSGTYSSPSHSISGATTFGNFVSNNATNGGSIAYAVCTSTSSDMLPKVCKVQTNNSQIQVGTNTYVQAMATFTITNATQAPTMVDLSVTWNSGARRPQMSSIVHDDRYWLALTTSTEDNANDATVVVSKGPVFTKFTQNAGALVVWKNAVYHADSRPTGRVYADNLGYNDNGAPIDAWVQTKDFAPDGLISDKIFDSLTLIADNLGAYNIYANYIVDRSTTSRALGTIMQNEVPLSGTLITRVNLPITTANQVYGKTISFKIRNNEVDAPMKIYGGSLKFRARPPI